MARETQPKPELLSRIKAALTVHYGPRLKGLVLYGSRARGDADETSDVDVLVLIDGPVDYGSELRAIVDVLYDLQLELGATIEAFPVDEQAYRANVWPLYRSANAEGIRL